MYGKENKPFYIRGILDEYDDIEFDSCGALRGSWIILNIDGDKVKIEREIDHSISVKRAYKGNMQIHLQKEPSNVKERDTFIGEEIMKSLSGYDSGKNAFNDNFRYTRNHST